MTVVGSCGGKVERRAALWTFGRTPALLSRAPDALQTGVSDRAHARCPLVGYREGDRVIPLQNLDREV
jgi:hypothetical protein